MLKIKSFSFLSFIPLLFTFSPGAYAAPIKLDPIEGVGGFLTSGSGNPGAVLEKFFSNLLGVFTLIGGLMFIIYFILGALGWITASGDPEKLKKSTGQMTNALLGLIIVVAAYSLFYIVGLVLGFNILNPAQEIETLKP